MSPMQNISESQIHVQDGNKKQEMKGKRVTHVIRKPHSGFSQTTGTLPTPLSRIPLTCKSNYSRRKATNQKTLRSLVQQDSFLA